MDELGMAIEACDSPLLRDACIMKVDAEAEGGIAADAVTLNSDAAVGGSVGGGSGERRRGGSSPQSGLVAGRPDAGGGGGGGGDHRPHARQRHHHRKRRSGSGSGGGGSLMNSSLSGGGTEHSIVSFGLNFNFDSTSSPSNSDSGEGAVHDGKGCGVEEGSNSDDDNNGGGEDAHGDAMCDDKPGGASSGAVITAGGEEDERMKRNPHHHKHHRRPEEIGESGDAAKKTERTASVKFLPEAATDAAACARGKSGEEEGSSTSSGSDSSMNDIHGGNASGGSNSGNEGSSGGKSTISTLTTSSNQEWMAAQNECSGAEGATGSADAQAVSATIVSSEAKTSRSTAQVTWDNGVEGGKDLSSKMKDATSGKKRKKTTGGTAIENTKTGGGNEDDDGYKTDEEWGGSGGPNKKDCGTNNVFPGRGPLATHKGSSSLLKASNYLSSMKSLSGSSEGPPMKQARFSMDHQYLSSLSGSDSAAVPIGNASSGGGQTLSLSKSSPAVLTMSSNPSSPPGQIPEGAQSALNAHPAQEGGTAVEPTKRKERNAREKERSCRIAQQIDDLRALLSRGGVTVSKTTKSSVLSEAANYISILQQQQAQWEMERLTLMQQVQQLGVISNPAIGHLSLLQKEAPISSVAAGVYPMAAQQAIAFPQQMSLGVQQGFPNHHGGTLPLNPPEPEPPQTAVNGINHNDYKFVFNNSSVGLAIASLGGAFIDCNSIFCHLSEYTKEEVCAMTIFNMTSRQDLQHAFDLISQMITPTLDGTEREEKSSIVLRGAMKNRQDLGLSISLIKGDHGIAKCFSVTLVRVLSNETTRQDTSVSVEMELPQIPNKQQMNVGFGASPAYTSG